MALRVLKCADGGGDRFEVQGRGELHLGVLIETMRREKFKLSISPPAVLFRQCETTGRRLEPVEELTCEVEETHSGGVIEAVVQRKGEMTDMAIGAGEGGRTRMTFTCPSRGLIGFRQVFINETRGTGTLTRAFHGYEPYRGRWIGCVKAPSCLSRRASPPRTLSVSSKPAEPCSSGPRRRCTRG